MQEHARKKAGLRYEWYAALWADPPYLGRASLVVNKVRGPD